MSRKLRVSGWTIYNDSLVADGEIIPLKDIMWIQYKGEGILAGVLTGFTKIIFGLLAVVIGAALLGGLGKGLLVGLIAVIIIPDPSRRYLIKTHLEEYMLVGKLKDVFNCVSALRTIKGELKLK